MIFYKNVLQPAYLSPQINYKMKKLNDTAITVLAIVSTILSYPSWLPVVLVGICLVVLPLQYTILFFLYSLLLFFLRVSLYTDFITEQKVRVLLCGDKSDLSF